MQEDQPNVTPDSSTTVNSKADVDNSLIMFQVMLIVCIHATYSHFFLLPPPYIHDLLFFLQEMFMDLFKWKEKMEQQLLDVSNTVYGMLAMK